MPEGQLLQRLRRYFADDAKVGHLRLAHDIFNELFNRDIDLILRLHCNIGEIRVNSDGEVGRERPGRRGPYEHEYRLVRVVFKNLVAGDERKLDVDGGGLVSLVFDLRLGEGGPAVDAPVDGLLLPVGLTPFEELRHLLE